MKKYILPLLLFFSLIASAQVVEEKVQIDTANITLKVIYREPVGDYYYKKVAVYANDTAQIAIEKTFNGMGQNGIYKVFYPSGRLMIQGVYANNKLIGDWTYYDEKGIIIIKGQYRNGVKHKYWAYKSIRTYGRYYKGLKYGKWKHYDENEKKLISHYKKGKLVKGVGFKSEDVPVVLTKELPVYEVKDTVVTDSVVKKENVKVIPVLKKEYQQAISFLTTNFTFRRYIKNKFGGSIKKRFTKEGFQYVISPTVMPLPIKDFIETSKKGKGNVAIIDSLLKQNEESLLMLANKEATSQNEGLYYHSTDTASPLVVFFSELNHNFLRIDVLKNKEKLNKADFVSTYQAADAKRKFSVLLYFNAKGVLKAAEYEED